MPFLVSLLLICGSRTEVFRISFQSREADLCVPGLLTAISYGAIAEQRNRRQLLLLSCVGMFLALLWIVVICMQLFLPARTCV